MVAIDKLLIIIPVSLSTEEIYSKSTCLITQIAYNGDVILFIDPKPTHTKKAGNKLPAFFSRLYYA
jgi:hypothetical protein